VLWSNKLLFWSVMLGFFTIFPVLYIPMINRQVFKHTGISWEWGIVLVTTVLFFAGVEVWKWGKRVFFRLHDKRNVVLSWESETSSLEKGLGRT
jgi:magnesium-transporting ATPase (P-type)